jgi:pyridoxal biosynthesis lyase PdxS
MTYENNEGASGPVNFSVKAGLSQMLKGGVIMDVVNAEQVSYRIPGSPIITDY